MTFFGLKPKFHALHHILWDVREALRSPAPLLLNPAVFSCDGNEDTVGRLCSIALSVSTRTINLRVIQRYFLKKSAVVRRHREARKRAGLRA